MSLNQSTWYFKYSRVNKVHKMYCVQGLGSGSGITAASWGPCSHGAHRLTQISLETCCVGCGGSRKTEASLRRMNKIRECASRKKIIFQLCELSFTEIILYHHKLGLKKTENSNSEIFTSIYIFINVTFKYC